MKFSIYHRHLSKQKNIATLEDVIRMIKIDNLTDKDTNQLIYLHEAIKEAIQKNDEKEYKELKLQLPAITWAGLFNENLRNKNTNIEYSSLIHLDFDHLENIDEIKQKLQNDEYTFILFKSASQSGLKLVVRLIYPTKDNPVKLADFYEKSHLILEKYFKDKYNLTADPSCKDVSRLCFLGYDKEIYYNNSSSVFNTYEMILKEVDNSPKSKINKKNIKSITKGGVMDELLRQARLNYVTFTYDEWLSMGYIFYHENGDSGLELFKEFSKVDIVSYNEKDCIRQWQNCVESYDEERTPSLKRLIQILKLKGLDIPEEVEKQYKYCDADLPYLIAENIGFCYINEITGQKYIKKDNKQLVLNQSLRNQLFCDIQKLYLNCREGTLKTYFERETNIKRFNPIHMKLKRIKTEDSTEFDKLQDYFSFQDDSENDVLKLKRYMIGSLSNIFSDGMYFDTFLIIKGLQSSGKTFFIRDQFLNLFNDYVCQSFDYESNKPDDLKMLSQNYFIFDDESTFTKKDVKSIKMVTSMNKVKYVEKYECDISSKDRIASFLGTTNSDVIFDDPTGGRRFDIIDLKENHLPGAKKAGTLMRKDFKLDWDKIWGYMVHLYENGLRHRDIEYVNNNIEYSSSTTLEKLVAEYFEISTVMTNFRDLRRSVTQIALNEHYDIRHLIDSNRGLPTAIKKVFPNYKREVSKDKKNFFYNIAIRKDIKISLDFTMPSKSMEDFINNIN